MILKKTNDVIIIKRIIEYLIKNKYTNINAFDAYEQFGKNDYNNFKEFQVVFKNYFNDEFIFELNNYVIYVYEKIPYFLFNLYYFKQYTIEQLYVKLLSYLNDNLSCKNFTLYDNMKLYSLLDAIDYINMHYEEEYYVGKFLCNTLFINNKISSLNKWLNDLKPSVKEQNISFILGNNFIQEFLTICDINTISQLADSSQVFINIIASYNVFSLMDNNYIYSGKLTDFLYEKFDKVFDRLTLRTELCLKYLYGLETGKKETLESVGILLGNITRERVRQLVEKGSQRIKKLLIIEKKYLDILLEYLKFGEKKYILFDDLIKLLKDEYIFKVILMVFSVLYENIKIDYKNNLIYANEYELDQIIDDFIKDYETVIKVETYEKYSKNIQLLLNYMYKRFNKVYIKREIRLHDIIDKIIMEKLDGIFIDNVSNINLINDILKFEYGYDEDYQVRNVKELIRRNEYFLIDKSTFMKKTKCVKLPIDLERSIFNHIISQSSNIYYEDIFSKFKSDLINLSINNRYYLKSLIDDFLPDEYNTTKDYIINIDNTTAILSVVFKMKSYPCSFTVENVINDMNDVSPKIIKRLIENEMLNGLLKLNNGEYIYKEIICNDNKVIETIQEILNNLITKNDEKFVSARQIYAKFCFNKLMDNLKFIHNSFDLFTYLKAEFSNIYYFSRPFIASMKDERLTRRIVVEKYINNYDTILFDQIDDFLRSKFILFQKKIDIVDIVSENYVLVSKNKLIRKDVLNLSTYNIIKISSMIDLVLKKEGKINSIKFNKFILMPNIGYKWNKYLLYGIITSYFDEKYAVDHIDAKLDILEYEIRSIENE